MIQRRGEKKEGEKRKEKERERKKERKKNARAMRDDLYFDDKILAETIRWDKPWDFLNDPYKGASNGRFTILRENNFHVYFKGLAES